MFPSVMLGSIVVAVMFGAGALFAGPPGGLGAVGLLFPVLGLLFATALGIVGSGAVIVSGFGSTPPESSKRSPGRSPEQATAPPTEASAPPATA